MVGRDLADLRPALAEVARRHFGTDGPPGPDITELGREALAQIREIFPGVDVFGTGWAALGTGMMLAKGASEVYEEISRVRMRARSREQRERWGNGTMTTAIQFSRIGDYLITES